MVVVAFSLMILSALLSCCGCMSVFDKLPLKAQFCLMGVSAVCLGFGISLLWR